MRALLLLTLLAACSKSNPYYCPDNPDDNCLVDADINTPMGCTTSAQCTNAAKPVCDTTQKVCVACTADTVGSCSGTTPVCSATNTCEACVAHSDCPSAACMPDGSCAVETQVAYVSSAGTGDNCTKSDPCPLLKDAIAKNLAVVKIGAMGAGLDGSTVVIDGKAVTILAEKGAKLDRNGDGVILEVRSSGADVKIYDLEITGASGVSGADAIRLDPNGGSPTLALARVKIAQNQGRGVNSLGGALTVTGSTIANNTGGGIHVGDGSFTVSRSVFANNADGGIRVIGGTFKISGNVFFANGGSSTSNGGITIQTTQSAVNRLDFNSFSKNASQDGVGAAISCVAGTFTARNNIMSGNGTLSNTEQVSGTCAHAYSIARPGTIPTGTGNTGNDPMFVNTTTGDLHIMNGSPAMGAADPNSDLTDVAAQDLDGQPRSSPADIGADELP